MDYVYNTLADNYDDIRSGWKMGNLSYELYKLPRWCLEQGYGTKGGDDEN